MSKKPAAHAGPGRPPMSKTGNRIRKVIYFDPEIDEAVQVAMPDAPSFSEAVNQALRRSPPISKALA